MVANPLQAESLNSEQAALIASLPRHLKAWDVDEYGCWIARKRQPNGYAANTTWGGRNGKKGSVYKLIWEYLNGPTPEGLELHHVCERGHEGCCAPFHLTPITHRENVLASARTVPSKHLAKTHCPQGHPYEGDNLMIQTYRGYVERHCRICVRERNNRLREKNKDRYRETQRRYEQSPQGKAKKAERQKRYRERKRAERGDTV